MTKQMPGWMLRDHANLADAYKQHIHDGGESALGDFLRDEAARREAEVPTMRADGWRSACPKCVASKFACDEHRKTDAPPPPAPDYDAMVKELRAKQVWPIVTADFFRFLEDQRNRSADAIEALRTQRDALKALFLPIAKDCAKELKLGTMEALLSCPDDMTKTDSGAHRLAHLVAQWDAEKKRAEAAEAEATRMRTALLICIARIESPAMSPDANWVLERARAALAQGGNDG